MGSLRAGLANLGGTARSADGALPAAAEVAKRAGAASLRDQALDAFRIASKVNPRG